MADMQAFGPPPIATNTCAINASWSDHKGVFDDWLKAQTASQAAWAAAYADAAEKARLAAFFQAAQQLAIAGLQYAAAQYIADKQFNIADRQMKIAETEHARYTEHFWCVENKLADEQCGIPEYTPDYETQAARSVLDVRRQFDVARQQLLRTRTRYCGRMIDFAMCDMAGAEARAAAEARNKAYRYEEARRDSKSDTRFNRMLQVSNLGRNIAAQSVRDMQAAGQLEMGILQQRLGSINNVLGALSGGLSGIIQTQFAPSVGGGNINGGGMGSAFATQQMSTASWNSANYGQSPSFAFTGSTGTGGLY